MRALNVTYAVTSRDEKSIEKYLTEVAKYEVLSPEEEVQLFKALSNGDETALDKIVLHNLRFVISVAKQYQRKGIWLGDLINEGNIGLIKAANRFDASRGFKFISYAVWWIRQCILQAINERSRNIRLPSNYLVQRNKINSTHLQFLQEYEREATPQELEQITGISERLVKRVHTNPAFCSSLDAPVAVDSETAYGTLLEDYSIEAPDYQLAVVESREQAIMEILGVLPKRNAIVLSMLFGIKQKRAMSIVEVADELEVSTERVRQIKAIGLKELKKHKQQLLANV